MTQSKKRIVSGMRSTGKLHLGHYFGVLANWKKLQSDYDSFFFIADWHALTTKFDSTETLADNVYNVALDWLSCGIDPNQSTIYVQSYVPQIAQLHIYLSMITPQNWVERDPTLKDMARALREGGHNDSQISYGLLGYPVLMTADIMMFNANYVPVGIDQVPHVELSRDIVRRFNNIYKTDFFVEPKPLLTQIPLMKGVDGNKMGKSFNNDIKISDDEKTTEKKIMSAITDRSRLKRDDPGHPEDCEVVYDYWKIFADKAKVEEIDGLCRMGQIGCAQCKKELAKRVNEMLAPIREKRRELSENPKIVREILLEGSNKAQKEAQIILDKVKEVVRMY
ncbi:TPA: tryptophan--tRNA ligase [Candidatus Galligastranaerophilus intestinavium]|uniref:Tryptophan--tRNA ligase n=1 Tax=Candidatus Galligastranaerophilus intestinavium TaxID=2840836 RepID=A0A9D1FGS0_9BACT|nr:tryptophan--tRNA ligase [Candidatus Galligastranaerophilus intestinavium]